MRELSTVEEVINSNVSLEKEFSNTANNLGWKYTDVLYSFLGIYTIGLLAFYPCRFECKGLIIQPKIEGTRQRTYSYNYIKDNYKDYEMLNDLKEMGDFIKVSQKMGNLIPIWPGGNAHKGQSHCYDIPDIYFSKEKIKDYADNFYNTFYNNSHFLNDVLNGLYSKKRVEDFLEFDESHYKDFLIHIIDVINRRDVCISNLLKING
jgi:hypothetical protein